MTTEENINNFVFQ